MQQSSGSRVDAISYVEGNSGQKYIGQRRYSFQGIIRSLVAVLERFNKPSPGLPQHRTPGNTLTDTPTGTDPMDEQQTLHLMACMQRGRYRRTVHQDRIDTIMTDQALFCFLRKQVAQHRGRIRQLFTLKCIQAMYFVKVSTISPRLD
jgi:hypothetical protein